MKKVKIAVIDSGISPNIICSEKIISSYKLVRVDNNIEIVKTEPLDFIGNGSAVASIIYETNNNIEIICFRICEDTLDISDIELIFILKYIYDNLDVDIINISAGLEYIYHYEELNKVCNNLYENNIIIIAAFDNDGAISYPASLESVIGVDVKDEYENKKDLYYIENSIVDIFVPNVYYRTFWKDSITLIKGTSFATAKITGIISKNIFNYKNQKCLNKKELLKLICNKRIIIKLSDFVLKPEFRINNVIIFPFNKESSALLRYSDMLSFNIVNIYDDRLSSNIGNIVYGKKIKPFESIDWEDNFDTVILSCTNVLSSITNKDYENKVIELCIKNNKNLYTFEDLNIYKQNIFYPKITSSMIPLKNNLKMYKPIIPVVSVLGTSSKQGKFSLQLEIIRNLKKRGYNVGHISTEPSGYLFEADFVYHFGYHSNLKIQPWESIALINKMIFDIQKKNKDIVITGSQTNTLHYNNSLIEHFGIYQYAFILGIMADFIILCVNPHDDIEYIKRTINFINAIDNGKVEALVIFPIIARETISGIKYKTERLITDEVKSIKNKFNTLLNIPVYELGNEEDIDKICEAIIEYF